MGVISVLESIGNSLANSNERIVRQLLTKCAFDDRTDIHVFTDKLYGIGKGKSKIYGIADKFFLDKQKDLIDAVKENPLFDPPTPFAHTRTLALDYVGMGAKMGEGWLLTAEILELIDEGVGNVVITQPFGCLPNHIVGKGMMKPIKENMPEVNLVAIDYDAGATKINQDNRIKLMLANAKK